MGFYQRHILPRLIDMAMHGRAVEVERQRLLPLARGQVLELGVGSGLNLPFYGDAVTSVVGLDPSPQLLAMASRRLPEMRRSRSDIPGHADRGGSGSPADC